MKHGAGRQIWRSAKNGEKTVPGTKFDRLRKTGKMVPGTKFDRLRKTVKKRKNGARHQI
jgi:hypothetical protein